MAKLDDAARTYRRALAGIDQAKVKAQQIVADARDNLATARSELAEAIGAEARAGTRQVDIIRRTGLSRERVRQILREQGISPDE